MTQASADEVKLSVVIPSRNAAATLPAQLAALAGQSSGEPWEVIVVDNGSRDATAQVAATFSHRLPALRVISATRGSGAGYARNRGVEQARGNAIAFCDADDVVAPGWVAAMREALTGHQLVGGPLLLRELNEPWIVALRPWLTKLEHGPGESAFLPWVASANLGVRRSLHERIGGFDERLIANQDVDYCWRAAIAGATLHFAPDARVHYRQRSDLRGIYRQARRHTEYYPLLLRKFRAHGLAPERVGWRHVAKLWGLPSLVLRDLPRAWGSREAMAGWMLRLGWRVGSLKGTIRFRRAYYR